MRESSYYNLSKQNSQKPKDIRGGEQKVMKKSLSTILSLAMAFSMFSSVALAAESDAAKTSADFTDLKDLDAATKAKFDALISAGVFDGVKEGTFGLKDEMNRAQFAKVAALIFNLKVDTTLKTSSFSDVKSDDPANGYAVPYIEAVKAAGITDGYAPGMYNPAGQVTKEQLATFLIRGLNKDADAKATPGVTDTTVSDWAKGYVALALQLKLLSNGTDGKFGGTSNATRDLLVLGASEAKAQYKGPAFNGKYAIGSFKATDADKLTLQLNGALTDDAAKNLKIEIKKDGSVVTNYTTKWSDDKTTATLTFDTKFQEATYAATISGLTNLDTTATTASVTTTKERIAKIEFLTAAETLPRTINELRIDFKATNQYGAKSSLTYNNFQINVSSGVSFKGISGEQSFKIKQDKKTTGNVNESILERNDRVSITIIHEDSGVTANKVFAIGEAPYVAKIEVGDLKNSSNVKVDTVDAQKDTYLDFKAYDQYGIRVEDQGDLIKGVSVYSSEGNVEGAGAVYTDPNGSTYNKPYFTSDEIGDSSADLKFRYNKNEAKDNVTLNLIANGSGQAVTKTLKVTAPKTPATIEFGNYTSTLAVEDKPTGDYDTDKKLYIPLIVKDAKGELLTPDDIVANFDKFTIYATGGIQLASVSGYTNNNGAVTSAIERTGADKGKIKVSGVTSKGNASVTVQLLDTPTVKATFSTTVGEKRKADKIAFSTAAKKYMIDGTDNEFKVKVYDQHGGELKPTALQDYSSFYKVKLRLQANSTYNNGAATAANPDQSYGVVLKSNDIVEANNTVTNGPAGVNKRFQLNPTSVTRDVYTTSQYDAASNSYINPIEYLAPRDVFDKSFKFFTNDLNGIVKGTDTKFSAASHIPVQVGTSYTLTAYLQAQNSNGTWADVNNVSTTLEVLNTEESKNKLTYEVYVDKGINNTILAVDDYLGGVTNATYVNTTYPKVAKTIKVRAKNSGGEVVNIPQSISSVTSSNPLVAGVVGLNVVGLDAGTAKLNVVYKDAKGDFQTSSLDVTTKNEGPAVASIVLKNTAISADRATLNALATANNLLPWDINIGEKITIKDQFGDEFISEKAVGAKKLDTSAGSTDQFVQKHQNLLNLTFYISDIAGTGNVAIDSATGLITSIDAGVTAFTVNVIAPSGVAASTTVTLN
jgi:hypothetical protein